MPFDASGTFTRLRGADSWKGDATAGTKIKSDLHDSNDNDLAAGLSETITKTGKTQPTANIPMNGKRIINLGAPEADTDAATKAYADIPKPFTTGAVIAGADANGRLNFTSPTGTNGLTFTGADLSWLARLAGAPAAGWSNRMVLNDKPDGSGTDLFALTDFGHFAFSTNATLLTNGWYDTTVAQWKARGAGFVLVQHALADSGAHLFYSTAASVAANAVAPLNLNFQIRADGSASSRTGFNAGGRVQGTDLLSSTHVYANGGTTYLGSDGNIVGPIWANWGAGDLYNATSARIESRAQAWAVAQMNNCVTATRMAGEVSAALHMNNTSKIQWGAYVLTGVAGGTNQTYVFYARQPQVYIPNQGWLAAFNF